MRLLSIIGSFILIMSFSMFVQSIYLTNITSEQFLSSVFDKAVEKQLPDICEQANLTECSDMNSVISQICAKYGETSQPCIKTEKQYNEMLNQKEELYKKEVFAGFSMFKLNYWLNLALKFGIVFILLGILLIYLQDRKIKTLIKKVSIIFILTGVSCLLFRFSMDSFFKGQNIPAEIVENFFSGLMSFEMNVGLLCLVVGITGYVAQRILLKEKTKQ